MGEACLLYDKQCSNCGECEMCDLDPDKRCDNCGTCLQELSGYRSVNIKDFKFKNK